MNKRPEVVERVRELAAPVVEGFGFELVHVEYAVGGVRVLRIYIDKPGGITVDDCADVSREMSTILDVEDVIPERYTLEVSSPGLDRPLAKIEDYARFAGSRANIKTREPVDGRKNFKVLIVGAADGRVEVKDPDGKAWSLEFSNIERGRLVPEF